jgi:LPXTG-motif cell wall-anchored protein
MTAHLGGVVSTSVGIRVVRRWRRALGAALAATLLASTVLVGVSVVAAQAASDGATEEIDPEKYPPPSQPEKTVTPKAPVSQPPELVRTGVSISPTFFAVAGVGLLLIGGGLLLARRKLSNE